MSKINFTKMVASGNDFAVIENGYQVTKSPSRRSLAKMICDRKYGAGADGLLVLERSRKADMRMRIFNADGSEAEMCGNGARCAALYIGSQFLSRRQAGTVHSSRKKINIETQAGIIESVVSKDNVKIKLTDPKNIKLNVPIKVNNHNLNINFIDTGVPHTVILAQGLDRIDAVTLGRIIRYHKQFSPRGANVNFMEVLNKDSIGVRTYERGVEDETLACGTGSVASALIYAILNTRYSIRKVNVLTKGGETLKVYFDRAAGKIDPSLSACGGLLGMRPQTKIIPQRSQFTNVWLEGRARIVYQGVYNV